jgi:uncharacterized protein
MKKDSLLDEQQKARELAELRKAMGDMVIDHPPTIGLVGVSGVGKSSTINTLFKTSLAVSDTVACTKEFRNIDLRLAFVRGEMKDRDVQLRVVDAPGLGEDIRSDPKYIGMYRRYLPECDIILWVLTARNRAVALDQMYLREFADLHERIVFGLHQVDLIEPLNWNTRINLPSKEQMDNLDVIVKDRSQKLEDTIQRRVRLIPYSSKKGYNLQVLFAGLIESCSDERAWIFEDLKNFKYEDFYPPELLERLQEPEQRASRSRKPFGLRLKGK